LTTETDRVAPVPPDSQPSAGKTFPAARFVLIIWILFLVRCAFYIVEQPLWEGLDEWAHFAAIQHVSQTWRMPDRHAEVSPEVRQSICESPLPLATTRDLGGGLSHAEFRMLSRSERSALTSQCIATIHPRQYEGQQPPLYYYLMAVPLALTPHWWPIADQALLIRALSSLLASTAIFSTALLAARVLPQIRSSGVLCAMLVAVFPGLCLNICRVGNESLSLALPPLLLLVLQRPSRRIAAGLILGLALLTKAYVLALTPLLFFCLPRWRLPRSRLPLQSQDGGTRLTSLPPELCRGNSSTPPHRLSRWPGSWPPSSACSGDR